MIRNFIALILISLTFLSACSSEKSINSNSAFYKTRWVLRAFSDTKVYTPESKEEPYIIFSESGGKAEGFGGCNNFNFIFSKKKQELKFKNIIATEKSCVSFMEIEKKYINVFVNSDSYRIKGNQLYLFKDSKLLARFESPELN